MAKQRHTTKQADEYRKARGQRGKKSTVVIIDKKTKAKRRRNKNDWENGFPGANGME